MIATTRREMKMIKGTEPYQTEKVEQLQVNVYKDREEMGVSAAVEVIQKMKELLLKQNQVRMIFASAPSQNEFLETLSKAEGIDWTRVTAFHMDEYIGLPANSSQKFSAFISEHLFSLVKPGKVHLIEGFDDIEEECRHYGELLKEMPIDIVCLGIGENGHIAFNDPPVADFNDPVLVKVVALDDASRQQQVNDDCFASFEEVPSSAITLTIPALLSAGHLFCIVPGSTKREAVQRALFGPIHTDCPASILRSHPNCTLFLDVDAYRVDSI